jgi:hypothetical protein
MTRRFTVVLLAASLTAALVPALAHGAPVAWSAARHPARLVGPSSAAIVPDVFEPDDVWSEANTMATDGVPVYHSFASLDGPDIADVDCVTFEATATHTYEIVAAANASYTNPVAYFGDATRMLFWNDNREIGSADAAIDWTCPATGTYRLEIADDHGLGGDYLLSVRDAGVIGAVPGTRIGGADRYAVAASVAATQFPGWTGIEHVVIASGLDRSAADPLTAAGLAGVHRAPILLVNQDLRRALPSATSAAIKAIKSHNATATLTFHLVGGTASVPSWVATKISAIATGAVFERTGGADRYLVAEGIAARMRAALGTTPTACLVANGETPALFFDALAASPVAYAQHFPILLTKKGSVPAPTLREARAGYAKTYVVGNTYEVAGSVVSTLAADRIGTTTADYDRTYVARRFAEFALRSGWLGRGEVLVTNKLPDALTGGGLAGSRKGALLFTSSSGATGEHLEDYVQQSRFTLDEWLVTGGPASVSGSVLARLQTLTGRVP